ncbi:opsin-3-like [Elgaria multicarinata webbii]|uniref:opsin-3-like n=1 Tax=Elgaria multicarinata webbii TaxID=159646 RepID=UPI002FCCF154
MSLGLDNRSLLLSNQSSAGNLSFDRPPLQASAVLSLGQAEHLAVTVCLGAILLLGSLSNLVVVLIFVRFQAIRTPINLILLNISLSDLLVCIFGTPFSFAASLRGRWLLGPAGCEWYGFANSLFGIVSLVSLSILSYERYVAVLRRHTKAVISSYTKSWLCIAGSWAYSLAWTAPPLVGWGSYGPEGPGITCSITWHAKTPNNVSYIVCLFVFCLALPLLMMIYCYGKILQTIRMQACRFHLTSLQKREHHILFLVVTMVTCFLLCWMPYGIVSLIATFGGPEMITPTVTIVPSILAKASTFMNPVLYVLLNKQFSRCFLLLLKCGRPPKHLETTLNSKLSQDSNTASGAAKIHLSCTQSEELQSCREVGFPSRKPQSLVVHYTF